MPSAPPSGASVKIRSMRPRASERNAIDPSASPEEAAAIVAALERFLRATAMPARSSAERPDGWQRAARLEGVERWPLQDAREPWADP
jgi:hypothetical protein